MTPKYAEAAAIYATCRCGEDIEGKDGSYLLTAENLPESCRHCQRHVTLPHSVATWRYTG